MVVTFVLLLQCRGEEGKVRHRVEHVLNKDQIKHIKRAGKWPQGFSDDAVQHAIPNAADAGLSAAETAQTTAEHEAAAESAGTSQQQQQQQPRAAVSAHGANTSATANGDHAAAAAGTQNECSDSDGEYEDSDTDSMDDLFVNTNRVAMMNLRTDYNSAESDEDEDDDAGDVDETAAAEQQQP
jgi:hypothetical protein